MFCTSCGYQLSPGMNLCPNCGAQVVQPAATVQTPSLPNYLVQSILVTLCCCMPFGIVAIVYAAQVSTKLAAGDMAGAQQASKNAKMWCWLGLAGGLVIGIIWMASVGVGILNQHGMR